MPLEYAGDRYTSLQEYIAGRQQLALRGQDSAPLYATPVDAWIVKSLNSTPMRSIFSRAMDSLVSLEFGLLLSNSIAINQRSFPDIYEVLAHCSRTLGIPVPHAVTQQQDRGMFNAFTAGTDDYAFIAISAALCQYFSRDEACFVVGHECGHIACRHAMYQTLVQILTDASIVALAGPSLLLLMAARVPLLAWSRRAEVTGDRAGLLCCGDLEVAERALLRLVTGLADPDRVDIEDYLRRAQTAEEFHKLGRFDALLATHPMIPKRIAALRLFARSEPYYTLSGKSPPPTVVPLTRQELDQRVAQIVRP